MDKEKRFYKIEEFFTKEDIEEARKVAEIAINDIEEVKELNKDEYMSILNLVQVQALEDLYKRRYAGGN